MVNEDDQTQHQPSTTKTKLPPLPKGTHISKRPLLHPPISSLHTSQPKEIYISARTPFISSIKRIQKYLRAADRRAMGSLSLLDGPAAFARNGDGGKPQHEEEEILVKGTGKAIANVLQVALYFRKQEGYVVRLRTGSVGAVDDVVREGDGEEETRVRRVSVLEVGIRCG